MVRPVDAEDFLALGNRFVNAVENIASALSTIANACEQGIRVESSEPEATVLGWTGYEGLSEIGKAIAGGPWNKMLSDPPTLVKALEKVADAIAEKE